MMDDLVKRLQRQADTFHPESLVATTAREAAAALEAKDAELARLRALGVSLCDAVMADDGSDHHHFTISQRAEALRRAALQAKE